VALEVPDSWGLTGKVAVVTGGGAAGDGIGNGRAAAILLARVGAHVVVVDRDQALAQRTVTFQNQCRSFYPIKCRRQSASQRDTSL